MKIPHLTEEEIQLYAMVQLNAEPRIINHVALCENCRAKAGMYKSIFTEIKKQPVPVFDFDVTSSVLPRLEPVKTKEPAGILFSMLRMVFIICAACIPLYFFRKNFLNIVTGMSAVFLYIILIACIIIIALKIAGMYNKYQQQIKMLNYSE